MQTQRVRGQCAAEWKEFKQTPDLLTDLYDPAYKMYDQSSVGKRLTINL